MIDLVLGQGFSAANLALAYAAWRQARPAAPPVTITRGEVSIVVADGSEETVRRIVEALTAAGTAGDETPGVEDGEQPVGGR